MIENQRKEKVNRNKIHFKMETSQRLNMIQEKVLVMHKRILKWIFLKWGNKLKFYERIIMQRL